LFHGRGGEGRREKGGGGRGYLKILMKDGIE